VVGVVLGPVVLRREYKAEKVVLVRQVQLPPHLIIRGELPLWWSSFTLINFSVFLTQENKLFTTPWSNGLIDRRSMEGLAEEEAFSTRTMGWDSRAAGLTGIPPSVFNHGSLTLWSGKHKFHASNPRQSKFIVQSVSALINQA